MKFKKFIKKIEDTIIKIDNYKLPTIKMKSIKARFQTLLLLFIFFPTILSIMNSEDKLPENVLSFGVVIAMLIGCYILIELLGKKLSDIYRHTLNIFIYLGIIIFIPILWLIGTNPSEVSQLIMDLYITFYILMIYTPLMILAILAGQAILLPLIWLDKKYFPEVSKNNH